VAREEKICQIPADLEEEEDEESELLDLDRQLAEAKTESERRFIQQHRDMMALSYQRSSRQRLVD
jgi:hypothetical protein